MPSSLARSDIILRMSNHYAAFISYAHHYKSWVATLQRNLETCLGAAGADPSKIFLDQTDLASGRSWVAQLQEGLAEADHLILIATPEAVASPRVENEWESFITLRPRWAEGHLHVVMLVDAPLPLFLDPIQRLDFVEHDAQQYLDALQKLVAGLLGRGARELGDLPTGLDIPSPPADVLPVALGRRLRNCIAPLVERKVYRAALADSLGVSSAIFAGHGTPDLASSAALVAATGDDDRVQAARRIVRALRDAFEEEGEGLLTELNALDAELARRGDLGTEGLLGSWLACVARDHSNLVPFFKHADLELLDRVYVQLELRPEERLLRGRGDVEPGFELHGPLTIHKLLDLDDARHPWVTHRWVVRGDPGAGKTTLLRHLAATLAASGEGDWVPVFASLPQLLREPEFLLARLERQLLRAGAPVKGLAAALETEAREGRLLLLLDGLDEVPRERREEAESTLRELAARWPKTPLVVTSRPIGYRRPGSGFVELDLLAFDEGQREEFLRRWFGRSSAQGPGPRQRAAEVMKVLRADPGLWDLAGNPLYLTLMALLFEEDKKPERHRSALYDQVFDLLLDGRHRLEGKPIAAKKAVYQVLRRLAFDMTEDDVEKEPKAEIEGRLLTEKYDPLCAPLRRVRAWEGGFGPFLDDVAEKVAILGPHDGPTAEWRYWHRTFREALTAERLEEELHTGGEEAILERARAIAEDEGRWAEPFALLVGRVEDPDALVLSLVAANRALGLRAVATAQRLRDETLNTVLSLTADWQERGKVYLEIPDLIDDPERALALVDQLRQRTRSGNDLFFLAETVGLIAGRWPEAEQHVERLRERFYDHLAVPPEDLFQSVTTCDGPVELWQKVPAAEGWVGAADGEAEHDWERPRHRVKIRAGFAMAAVPVTNAQYAVFDPAHVWEEWEGVSREELAQHPVVKVSWYAAMSFCRWLATHLPGARLPTEEEWEVACRAGTTTRYWSGDGEEDLARVGWYSENSGKRTHRVGEKPANPWQLYDMHGNVWEWTLTAYDDDEAFLKAYEGRDQGRPFDAASATTSRGGGRVVRGGSIWLTADWARSAYRFRYDPGAGIGDRGFRVVLPRP
jgi:formylglycine-generating enzyme required for sulfatase activity